MEQLYHMIVPQIKMQVLSEFQRQDEKIILIIVLYES